MKHKFRDSWSKTKSIFILQKIRKNYVFLLQNIFVGCAVSIYQLVSGTFDFYKSLEDTFVYCKIFFILCLLCSIIWGLFYYNIIKISNKYQIKIFKFSIFCCDVIISSISLAIGISLISFLFCIKFEIIPAMITYPLYIEIFLKIKSDFQDTLEFIKKMEEFENSINKLFNSH